MVLSVYTYFCQIKKKIDLCMFWFEMVSSGFFLKKRRITLFVRKTKYSYAIQNLSCLGCRYAVVIISVLIQCYLDMHKPLTSKPQLPSERKPQWGTTARQSRLRASAARQERRGGRGANAQGGTRSLALLWTAAEHFVSSIVWLYEVFGEPPAGGVAHWTCTKCSEEKRFGESPVIYLCCFSRNASL